MIDIVYKLRHPAWSWSHDGGSQLDKEETLIDLADAADEIDRLRDALTALANAEALSGIRAIVAGWNGEGRDESYQHRHPDKLGATLPKTTCGAVYALDEAIQNARAALTPAKRGGADAG